MPCGDVATRRRRWLLKVRLGPGTPPFNKSGFLFNIRHDWHRADVCLLTKHRLRRDLVERWRLNIMCAHGKWVFQLPSAFPSNFEIIIAQPVPAGHVLPRDGTPARHAPSLYCKRNRQSCPCMILEPVFWEQASTSLLMNGNGKRCNRRPVQKVIAETKRCICRVVQFCRQLAVERDDGLARPRPTTKLPEWTMHVDALLPHVLPLRATNRGANLAFDGVALEPALRKQPPSYLFDANFSNSQLGV